jgi:hypothetical protein
MRAKNEIDQAVRIVIASESPFSLDLMVRTPRRLERDLKDADWFLREVMTKGKVPYEASDQAMGPEGRSRLPRRSSSGATATSTK